MVGFAVVAMVKEPSYVLRAFVDHYRRSGAESISLYFEGTEDECSEAMEGVPMAEQDDVILCDAAYWDARADDARLSVEDKQKLCYLDQIKRNQSDWLLICDADEFLRAPSSLTAFLARLPPDVPGICIRNTEAVWGPGDDRGAVFGSSYERDPLPDYLQKSRLFLRLVYGSNGATFARGTMGHDAGKQVLRRGVLPEAMRLHNSLIDGEHLHFLTAYLPDAHEVRFVHFDAVGFDRWLWKWKLRLSGVTDARNIMPVRLKQMAAIEAALREKTERELFETYYGLTRWQFAILKLFGLARRTRGAGERGS